MKILHLVLSYHWYDEYKAGRKDIEYRAMSKQWKRLIWDRRDELTHVRFARAYTSTTQLFEIESITIGTCPYDGWDECYYKIACKPMPQASCQILEKTTR